MARDIVCHRAPVVVYGSVRMLIFDALTSWTTICEMLIAHTGRSFLRPRVGIPVGALRRVKDALHGLVMPQG